MVLKKSNSCLNSGATQRLTGGKVVALQDGYINPLNLLSLSFGLRPGPGGMEKNDRPLAETVITGLGLLGDYLSWSGPSIFLDDIAEHPGRIYSRQPMHVYCGLESNKTWRLHQRLKAMMCDQEFLRRLSPYMSVTVEESRHRPAGSFSMRRKTWTSDEAIAPSSDPSEPVLTARDLRRARNTQHSRGAQRPHLRTEDQRRMKAQFWRQREHEGRSRGNSGQMVVTFNMHTWQKVDARWTNSDFTQRRNRNRVTRRQNPLRSLKKLQSCKGSVGRLFRECVDVMDNCGLDATDDEMNEENDDDSLSAERDHVENVDSDTQGEQHMEEYNTAEEHSHTERSFSLEDFIHPAAKMSNKRKERKKIRPRKNTTSSINELSSQGHHVFPKGSYVYVSKQDALSFLETSPEVVELSLLEIPEEDEKTDASDSPDLGYFSNVSWFQAQSSLEKEAEDMQADAVDIVLQESKDEYGLFLRRISSSSLSLRGDQEVLLVNKHTIHVGHTQPSCFLVHLQVNGAEEDCDNPPGLVVKGHAPPENNAYPRWSVSIGADISAEQSKTLNNDFRTSLANLFPSGIRLGDLISAASACTARFYDQLFKSQTQPHATIQSSRNNALAMKTSVSLKFQAFEKACSTCVSVKEACRILTAERTSGTAERTSGTAKADAIQQRQEYETACPRECEICLLPSESVEFLQLTACGHGFCVPCWSSHVLRLLQDGASQVLCMASGCSSEVSKAAMSSLVPYRLVCRWAERVRDRFLETQPSCKWCPRQGCRRLAVIDQGGVSSLPGQFGETVTCPCGNTWCFGCQGDLHWPASCDQMAAYKHLRSHLDSSSENTISQRSIDFLIELKPCPTCKYPIEKNKGCPSMVCRMCWTNFCWNCLQVVSSTHNVYECTASESYTTYRLTNKLANEIPIRYYPESVQMDKQFSEITSRKMQVWLKSLQNAATISKPSSNRQEQDLEALRLATECVDFLKNTYVFLEFFFILMSFAYRNKKEISRALMGTLVQKLATMEFISGRLTAMVICKSRRQILTSRRTARLLLVRGQRHLSDLVKHVAYLQRMTDKVDTEWIKKLDPKQYMRYK